jgi:acetyl-CoA C-acetyltransferase
MVDRLRADDDAGATGVVSGVGMHMTKHIYGVYSTAPGPVAPVDQAAVQQELDAVTPPRVVAEHDGPARVVAYSVEHGRDGEPTSALLVCDVADGVRTYARLIDADACRGAEVDELIGRTARLRPETHTGPAGEVRRNVAAFD